MQLNINGTKYEIKKGMKLLLTNDRIATVTGREPWSTSTTIKFKADIEGRIETVRSNEVLDFIEYENTTLMGILNRNKLSEVVKSIKNFENAHIKSKESTEKDDNENEFMLDDTYEDEFNDDEYDNTELAEEDEEGPNEVLLYKNDIVNTEQKEFIDSKTNKAKPRMSLIPQKALLEVAKVMTYGATKYKEHSYSNGEKASVYIDAALRHINKYLCKDDVDDETHTHHLANAIADLMMSLDNIINHKSIDDRNKNYEN